MSDTDDITDLQQELTKDIEENLAVLGPALISTKMQQHQIFSLAAANGGPNSTQGALQHILDYVKIGVRPLAAELKISRKVLQRMIEDDNIAPDIISKIWDIVERKKPGLLSRLENMKFDD